MSWSSLKAYFILDMKVNFREKVSIAMMLLMPAVFYLFFASFYSAPTEGAEGASFYNDYTVSFASVILLSIALMNLGPMIVISKEGGFYKRLFVTPLRMSEVWLCSILRALILFFIGYLEMILLGYFMFGELPQASLEQILIPSLISAYALLSMGFLLGALLNASVAAYNAGMILFQPMLLLSGAGFPLEMLPEWARAISYLIPFTYVVELMRLGWMGSLYNQEAILPSVVLLIVGSVCALIAARSFKHQTF
ncbi:ABC transporter permease [Bowmanella dokdonensis]|uniref:Transport permease protein n=1 Tax=Bowmanella dokdonensis TaxID=751969 RepID=A0A939IML8_9ALTE|nr:ABC transporter permease [Bowmanella dokdonensis]MBN7823935.1 ABC transporter permease [Bowmanella dokdonensis]